MRHDLIFQERVSSMRTLLTFVALTILCLALLIWRVADSGFGAVAAAFLILTIYFFFCILNYRVLVIRISEEGLQLIFGLFRWAVPWRTVAAARIDETSLWRIGGAGIHFSFIGGRYRAMFNFLEHQRVVIEFNKKRGLVRDIAFSTTRPDEILRIIETSIAARNTA